MVKSVDTLNSVKTSFIAGKHDVEYFILCLIDLLVVSFMTFIS